jgi:hypothetical protein
VTVKRVYGFRKLDRFLVVFPTEFKNVSDNHQHKAWFGHFTESLLSDISNPLDELGVDQLVRPLRGLIVSDLDLIRMPLV